MPPQGSHRRAGARRRPGFSLVESAVSVVLVGVLMVAALQAMGASQRHGANTVDRLLGQQLATALMNEILLQAYKEPESDEAPIFGLEPGESTGNRALFDDVDDYSGWASSPPQDRNGTAIPGFTGWSCSVSVTWANPVTLGSTADINTGLKKIAVSVTKNGQVLGSMVSYRSVAWVDTIPTPSDATGNHPPVAMATSPDLTRRVGETVQFIGNTSSDQDGDYLSYVWNFADGTTGTGATVTHIYNTAGNFSCMLTVYDGHGGVGTAWLTAIISP